MAMWRCRLCRCIRFTPRPLAMDPLVPLSSALDPLTGQRSVFLEKGGAMSSESSESSLSPSLSSVPRSPRSPTTPAFLHCYLRQSLSPLMTPSYAPSPALPRALPLFPASVVHPAAYSSRSSPRDSNRGRRDRCLEARGDGGRRDRGGE
jgi:hypothetical protein|uniref:Uncharacterized protein n=2 Tax=Oryza sativa subsp. japonica TaxID=39947 RepID=Q7G1P7_ORYSJ|nr:hypothetical protein [Oryza sativa Japonica Group]AAP55087.1 hypothetical protein LOC_Os10g41920 [Oryza sativa Japonica Group]